MCSFMLLVLDWQNFVHPPLRFTEHVFLVVSRESFSQDDLIQIAIDMVLPVGVDVPRVFRPSGIGGYR